MKIELLKKDTKEFGLSFLLYFPNINFRKKRQCEVGPYLKQYKTTEINFPTAVKFVEVNNQIYLLFRVLGFGFSIHFKEK